MAFFLLTFDLFGSFYGLLLTNLAAAASVFFGMFGSLPVFSIQNILEIVCEILGRLLLRWVYQSAPTPSRRPSAERNRELDRIPSNVTTRSVKTVPRITHGMESHLGTFSKKNSLAGFEGIF